MFHLLYRFVKNKRLLFIEKKAAASCRTPNLRRVLEWCAVLGGLWLALLCGAGCLVNRLAFHPEKLDASWRPVQGEEIFFEDNGTRLHGILLAAKEPRAVIVHCHGNAQSVKDWQWEGWRIRDALNVTVFIWDYPGFGKSEGRATPASVMSAGRAAVAAVARHTGLPQEEIIVMGRSIGAAVAVDAACHANAKALILESGFTSLRVMCQRVVRWLPWTWILSEPMDSEKRIAAFQGPVFVAHGQRDSIVPFAHGERLFQTAVEPKGFYRGNGDHNDEWPDRYYKALEKFLTGQGVLK